MQKGRMVSQLYVLAPGPGIINPKKRTGVMAEQLKFRDNHGTVNIINRTGRPTKNPKESLGQPKTFRFYESEEKAIQKLQYDHDLNRQEVVQKCVQVGIEVFNYLDWISHNIDTIKLLAQRYNRKKGAV